MPCAQGLWVMPVSGLWLTPFHPCSEVVVLPSGIAPAAASRSTQGALSAGTLPFCVKEPRSVGIPAVSARSLIVTGTPCSGPSAAPDMTFASASLAASRARSAISVAKALIRGSSRSTRASTVSTISTGESSRAATIAASRVAGVKHRSSSFIGPLRPRSRFDAA